MAVSFNQATVVGYVGAEPKSTTTQNGHLLTTFSVATTERIGNGNGNEQTEWHNIVTWSKLAEVASKFLHKGSCILIQGRLRTRNYLDNNNVKHYVTEIIADRLQLLDKRSDTGTNDGAAASGAFTAASNQAEDEVPF